MATIVKPGATSAPTTPAAEHSAQSPPSAEPGVTPVTTSRTGRIIKTVAPAQATAPKAGPVADAGSPKTERGVSGRISNATLGNNAKGKTGLAEFNLSDLAAEGREQIKRCQQQVDEMLAAARKQAEQLRATAREQGHTEGTKAAISDIEQRINREAEAKAKNQVESLRKAVLQMKQQYDDWMRQYAEVLTVTAIAAAERLTRSQLHLPNSEEGYVPTESGLAVSDASGQASDEPAEHLLVRWAREALHSTRSASRLTLAVHPDTLAQLGRALDELLAHPDLPEQSVVVPDETLKVGDVVVRQDGGEISAGLDAQLSRLREELL
ncbi:FliH/SctL family protein [Aporhodopirellula aestuarii]|uniref:FliH/SctL family protein n=1 Tax=Aporhodopirellula aestuarii TaxID=2950107 RepID=A0ABT0U7D7_9BACT|nr:FliH/SctL family protein [Aporhodopirellula aestuarii]MCM2372813.1 FliH/SctL family protein [Aporhodopirellula aestuarii]